MIMNVIQAINAVQSEIPPLTKENVFTGLGCLPGEYHIEVDPTMKPVQHAPRRVPVPLKTKLKAKIEDMKKKGIIKRVTEPTEWISSAVAVEKKGKLCLCIDP